MQDRQQSTDDELVRLMRAIDHAEEGLRDLREARAARVARLRAEGWSLQRIADSVGRTKQTVSQWVRSPGS